MQKWKIIQFIINLPKDQQISAVLLFFIFISLGSNTALSLYFNGEINELKKENADDKKYYHGVIKTKDSVYIVAQNRHLDFVEDQLKIRYQYRAEIDSIKIKNQKQ